MVLIGDQKHACQTCIKGHRSSTCNHADRPLFPIKRKGRPTTQCDHCRELRKTRRVHVKCMCGSKNSTNTEPAPPTIIKSFSNPTPPLSDGSSSDSDHSCNCGSGQKCHCWTPRDSASNHTKRRSRVSVPHVDTLAMPSETTPASWFEGDRPQPSVLRHERVHNGGSPYGQAYAAHQQPHNRPVYPKSTPPASISDSALYDPNLVLTSDYQLPSLCSCPAGCRCIRCTTLHSHPLDGSQCNELGSCDNCFDCSMLSTPLPPQYGSYSGQDIDSWIQQTIISEEPYPDLFIPDLNIPTTPFDHNPNINLPPEFAGDSIWTRHELDMYPTISSAPLHFS